LNEVLVDAQLPRRLARFLNAANHDALHTLDLPRRNLTPDDELCEICARENRILVSKDLEFADSFVLKRQPPRLLLVSTGNIANKELESLFRMHLSKITDAFYSCAFVELDRSGMTVHVLE
jgi:predicted nuclease of predicted toxin-antitoxin system